MTKKEKAQVLQTYRDIIETIKTNTTTDLITAMSKGNVNVPEEEYQRITSLIESLVDLYSANGYELLQRTLK